MRNFRGIGILAGLALSVSASALGSAYASEPTTPPAPAGGAAAGQSVYLARAGLRVVPAGGA
ncbi:hypothetical protein, partial [Mesorhizobium sp. M1143]|uniref:hypothetical protein n=1 Tax=Mesorhizobium sp. M1143 TaxID=2957061 RepID=UPI00333BE676